MSEQEKIRGYRERAQVLRTIAQDFTDDKTQSMLANLAREYERMAEELERNPPPKRAPFPHHAAR